MNGSLPPEVEVCPSPALSPTLTKDKAAGSALLPPLPGDRPRVETRSEVVFTSPARAGPRVTHSLPCNRALLCLTHGCLLGPPMGLPHRKFPERVAAAGLQAAHLNPRSHSGAHPCHFADVGEEAPDAGSCPGREVVQLPMEALSLGTPPCHHDLRHCCRPGPSFCVLSTGTGGGHTLCCPRA